MKFSFVMPRILFFNITYLLFPLLIVWLSFFAVLYFFGFTNMYSTFEEFTYLISIMGIVLGFFQYYVKRHEEKIQNKIVGHLIKLTFPKDKFSFKSFIDFIENINNIERIKKTAKEIEEGKIKPNILHLLPRMSGKELNLININIPLPWSEDKLKFTLLENNISKKDLVKIYKDFFKKKKEEIINGLVNDKIINNAKHKLKKFFI